MKKHFFLFIILSGIQTLWGLGSVKASTEIQFGAGSFALMSGGTQMDFTTGFHITPLWPWLQAGVALQYAAKKQQEIKTSSLYLFFGPTANFGGPISDAFFISVMGAIRSGKASDENGEIVQTAPTDTSSTSTSTSGSSSSSSTTADEPAADPNGFGLAVFAGKRFPIIDRFLYRPSIGIVTVGSFGFVLNILQVSYEF